MNKNKRYVLITGVSGGIGGSLVKVFFNEGYTIIGTDIIEPINDKNIKYFIKADLGSIISNDEEIQNFYINVKNILKDDGLHAIVNNAAIQIVKNVSDLTINDVINSFKINCAAPFMLIKIFLIHLEKCYGSVVNISSIHAELSKPEFVAYATSKSALSGLTKSLALELGDRVRINAIAPAAVTTQMLLAGFESNKDGLTKLSNFHPVGRIGEPYEVAQLALFLTSDSAKFINGSVIKIDGGISNRLYDPS
jgi:NAD(P)-dependent dehydrogenase (short-subunit alcohol dehydrogenase family)